MEEYTIRLWASELENSGDVANRRSYNGQGVVMGIVGGLVAPQR